MKRVLFLTNLPTPYRMDFYNELSKYCYLTVLFEGHRWTSQQFNWNDEHKNSFQAIYLEDFLNERKVKWTAFQYLNPQKYDRIIIGCYHTYTQSLAILYMKLRGIPYIFETDGGMITPHENFIKKNIKHFLISGATKYLSPSAETDQYLQYYGAKIHAIHRYPFSSIQKKDILESPLAAPKKEALKKELGIQEKFIILGIGQFIPRKGFDVLIEACANLPESIGTVLIGGKPTNEYIELAQKYRPKHLYFESFKSKEELAKYFQAADLFILPTREDIWGLVINEAMAYGLPVITTTKCVAGLALLENKECIIPAEAPKTLQDRINYLFNNPAKRAEISQRNINTIKQYTIEQMAEKIYKIIDQYT